MAEGIDETLQRMGEGVCLIKVRIDEKHCFKGTGFHYGGGWIMTNAHIFQDDDRDDEKTHSLINQAQFSFFAEDQTFTFCRRTRTAFVHHLKTGEYTDFHNKDIAMVKLGYQNPENFEAWEEEEEEKLRTMNAHSKTFTRADWSSGPHELVGQSVRGVHFGGSNNDKKFVTSVIKRMVPMLHLEDVRSEGVSTFPSGASGSPILIRSGDKYLLVGLLFSGDEDESDANAEAGDGEETDANTEAGDGDESDAEAGDEDESDANAEAEALSWTQGIEQYINEGVDIIANIGVYMGYKKMPELTGDFVKAAMQTAKDKEKAQLIQTAKINKLTVYLNDGEVLK